MNEWLTGSSRAFVAGQAQPAGAQQLVRVYLPLPALQAVVALLDALAADGLEAGVLLRRGSHPTTAALPVACTMTLCFIPDHAIGCIARDHVECQAHASYDVLHGRLLPELHTIKEMYDASVSIGAASWWAKIV